MLNLLTPRKQLMSNNEHRDQSVPYIWAETLEADLQTALDEPPFLDRERASIDAHLAELRAEAEQKIAAIEHHKSEIALLEAELAERQRSIEAHEAAASKLTELT